LYCPRVIVLFTIYPTSNELKSISITHLLKLSTLSKKSVLKENGKYMCSSLYKFILPLFILNCLHLNLRKGKNRREYKVPTKYSQKVTFAKDKKHMVLSVLSCKSSQIRACHVTSSFNVRQWSFQEIYDDPIVNPSL